MKISNLLTMNYRIVQHKKAYLIAPLVVVVIAAVMMLIFGLVKGSPLNLGMDFQGGYTVNVKLSTKLTDATLGDYKSEITNVVENLRDKDGKPYGLKVSLIQRQGSGDNSSLYVKYKAVDTEEVMEKEINPALQEALQERIFKIVPVFTYGANTITVDYGSFPIANSTFKDKVTLIEESAKTNGVTKLNVKQSEDFKKMIITAEGINDSFKASLDNQLTINDKYSGQAQKGDVISATVSSELLTNAILAICLSIVLMLVYIAFRFEVSSGLAAVIALAHDIIMMFCFMAIFNIEINSTFIAALITILGYSINNTIIIFDRIRENTKSLYYKNSSATEIANNSIKDTILRSVNTTVTTLITISMVAIIGVPSIRIFAVPIIIGLLSGTFSSICIAPTVWATWKDRKKRTPKDKKAKKVEKAVLADV